ncbi:hypothetical protein ACX80L_08365 [Arthrobacter sp. MDT1-48-3]
MNRNKSHNLTSVKKREAGRVYETVENRSERNLARALKLVAPLLGGFILLTVLNTLQRSSEGSYWLPRTADDWAAWAAWFGLLATVSAVFYAAKQYLSDTEEKRIARHARDAEARSIADALKTRVASTNPIDPEYPNEQPDPTFVDGVNLYITNYGEKEIKDIQVKIPDVKAKVVYGGLGPQDMFSTDNDGSISWRKMVDHPYLLSENQQLWICGSLAPGEMMRLTFEFAEVTTDARWTGFNNDQRITGRLAVIFTDYMDRSWVRSTGDKRLQRLWPESVIEEQAPLPVA